MSPWISVLSAIALVALEPAPVSVAPDIGSSPQTQAAAVNPEGLSTLVGRVTAGESPGVPVAGVEVRLSCPRCGEPTILVTDADGRFRFTELPMGTYALQADRGGGIASRVVAVGSKSVAEVELVATPPETSNLRERRVKRRTRASLLVVSGGLAAVAGSMLLIGGGVERAKPVCKFGLPDCDNASRPGVALGLSVAGGTLLAAGAALVGVGVHQYRRLHAELEVTDRSAALAIRGRF